MICGFDLHLRTDAGANSPTRDRREAALICQTRLKTQTLGPLARLPGMHLSLRSIVLAVFGLSLAANPLSLAAQAPSPAPSIVVIDAAHGGGDTGAALGAQSEKAYTLSLSVRLRSLLAARGFQVITTRESDAAIEPDRRIAVANHAGAIACLSLHATTAGSGVHILVSSLGPADQAHFTPWKTAQAAWVSRSLALAGVLNSALSNAGIAVTLGRVGLPVIDSLTCPAVAVEIAPRRTAGAPGAESLDDPAVQANLAEALAAALVEWRSVDRGARQP